MGWNRELDDATSAVGTVHLQICNSLIRRTQLGSEVDKRGAIVVRRGISYMKSPTFVLALALGSGCTCASASDFNPLGFYVGASVGQSRELDASYGLSGATDVGWKMLAGLRPLRFVGVEAEYVSFGSPAVHRALVDDSAHATAAGAFGVGYLPIPFIDVFGKVGWLRTRTTANGLVYCAPPALCIISVQADRADSALAYGAGVQAKLNAIAFRAEYERTETGVGHPQLLSFGITWTL